MIYEYEVTWLNGDVEILRGESLMWALYHAGYEGEIKSFIKSWRELEQPDKAQKGD